MFQVSSTLKANISECRRTQVSLHYVWVTVIIKWSANGGVLVLRCQLDESCVQQHVNERRVRTLEEEDEAAGSVTEVDTASADNDDLEYDLEELSSIENDDGKVIDEEDGNDTSDSVDDTHSNDIDDSNDYNPQLKSVDIFSSDVPRTDAQDTENDDNLLLRDSDVDISGDIVSSTAEVAENTSSAVAQIGQASDPADSEAADSINMETHQMNTESQISNAVDEFPDTSIELHHVSGSTYVS